jgi:hypothetical protein
MDLGVAGEFVLANIMTKGHPITSEEKLRMHIQIQKFWAECDLHMLSESDEVSG